MSVEPFEPRAREMLRADPERIGRLAGFLREAAEHSARSSTGLRAAQHDVVWRGPAADTFRRAISPMPARLDALHTGFRDTGTALAVYAGALERLQREFRGAAADARNVQARLPSARSDANAARAAMRRIAHTPGATAAALIATRRQLDHADRCLSELEDERLRLGRRLDQCLEDFQSEQSSCRVRIGEARRLAPAAVPVPAVGARFPIPIAADLAPPA